MNFKRKRLLLLLLLSILFVLPLISKVGAQVGSIGLKLNPDHGPFGQVVSISFDVSGFIAANGPLGTVQDARGTTYTIAWDIGGYPAPDYLPAGYEDIRRGGWTTLGTAQIDASGILRGTVTIPLGAKVGVEHWIYAIPPPGNPPYEQPFYYWWGEFEVTTTAIANPTSSNCFIATATYGSELSPEVQFLRDFRENAVMGSFVGRQFVAWFNSVYYSFSPAVASSVSSSEASRDWMKSSLLPMMGILHLGAGAYSMFGFSPDLGIVVFVLLVSSLMSLVYLVPAVLITLTPMLVFRKTSISTNKIKRMGIVWIGCMLALLVAAVAKSPILVMASGAALVGLTVLLMISVAVKLLSEYWIWRKH